MFPTLARKASRFLAGFAALVLLMASPVTNAQSRGGGGERGSGRGGGWSGSGGDSYSPIFRVICISLAQAVKALPHKAIPSQDYDINWDAFQHACVNARIKLALKPGTEKEWEDLRDDQGSARTLLFVKNPVAAPLAGDLVLHGPRFLEELQNNLEGSIVNVVHEIVKTLGVDDDGNKASAQVFLDYNEAFARTAVSLSKKLASVYQDTTRRLELVTSYEGLEAEKNLASVERRMEIARRLQGYLDGLMRDLIAELRDDQARGLELSRSFDRAADAHWAKISAQAEGVRAQMNRVADAVENMLKNTSPFAVFPSQAAGAAGGIIRVQAEMYGLRPLQPKSSEMEWMEAQLKSLAEEIVFKTDQLRHYRKQKQAVADRLIEVEIKKF